MLMQIDFDEELPLHHYPDVIIYEDDTNNELHMIGMAVKALYEMNWLDPYNPDEIVKYLRTLCDKVFGKNAPRIEYNTNSCLLTIE